MKQAKSICPKCGKKYTGFPSLSRRDNKASICPDCGQDEAMFDLLMGLVKEKESAWLQKKKGSTNE